MLYEMMQPQQLRVLVAVHEHGSLSRAARALDYGVPTIAHHITALERHLQVQLVDRDRRGARLTPLGRVLVSEASEILARLDQAEQLVVTQRDRGLATIRIGTFASLGSQVLPRAVRLLRERATVQVEVVEAEPTEVVQLLQAGELNAGLIYDSVDDPAFTGPDLTIQVLLEERYEILLSRISPLAEQTRIDMADLAEADWICSRDPNETSDRVLRRVCHLLDFEPRVLMRTDDLSMIHGLVAENLGCTLTTRAALDTRFAVEVRPTVQDLGLRRTSFVRRNGVNAGAVDDLLHIIMGLLPPLPS
jgi:DNA-binding transcriptional LysR family regulator